MGSLEEKVWSMAKDALDSRAPVERLRDLPRILEALQEAAGEAMLRHRQAGIPAAIWRDGKVELVEPVVGKLKGT